MNKFKNYKYPIILLLSIIVGSTIGLIFKEKACVLEGFGTIYINMLFIVVVPLVFTTISSSIASINSFKRLGRIFKYMFIVFIITSLISSIFMLIGLMVFKPSGVLMDTTYNKESIDIVSKLVQMVTVDDFYKLLSKSNMLPLIVFTCLFGFSIKLTDSNEIKNILNKLSKVFIKMISLINMYAPIGLCAYFASLTGVYGKEFIGSYAKCFILYIVMAVLYYVIFYSLYTYIAYRKKGVKLFYKNILLSTITSLGTCSSLATLPVNIKTSKDMKLDDDISNVVLPIGSTIHMEGSSMASILKIGFLFSLFGMSFNNFSSIVLALVISVLSATVMSGIPGGALIGELLIVSLYNFPPVAFSIIATIGWIIDSPGTCLNAVGDIPSLMLINKLVNNKN